MSKTLVLLMLLWPAQQMARAQTPRHEPIIDMHLHPWRGETTRVKPAPGVDADEAFRRAVMTQMDQYSVVLAVGSGPVQYITAWRDSARGRVLVGPMFPCVNGRVASQGPDGMQCFGDGEDVPELNWLRNEYKTHRFAVMGELTNSYAGIAPDDSLLDPYFALAAELDVPVAIHTGSGPDSRHRRAGCCPNYSGAFGNPALLEPVLRRYPQLRIQLMHAGEGFRGEAITLLKAHPNVYVDLSPLYLFARAPIYVYLKQLVDAGLGDRVMFGTDYSLRLAEHAAFIDEAPFLTAPQKSDIFFNNAARFLRLSANDISRLRNSAK
jgi:hypothetical protein